VSDWIDYTNRPPALYRLIENTHTGEKRPRMGFFVFGKAHTGSLYGFLPSANIGQEAYWLDGARIRSTIPVWVDWANETGGLISVG
jgi:hypothetical protein